MVLSATAYAGELANAAKRIDFKSCRRHFIARHRRRDAANNQLTTTITTSSSRRSRDDSIVTNNNNGKGGRQAKTRRIRRIQDASKADKENDDNGAESTTSSLQSQNSNVGGDRQDMDVDFTGSGGGGDVDMTDESDDTSSTPPGPTPRRSSPRLAPNNNRASSSTSAQAQSGDTASTTATTSAVKVNGRTLPHVNTAVHLPSPHNHESYGNHPQLREHKNCPGDSCTRGSCILRRMIPQMKPGGDLDYNYDEKRIVVNQFYPQLRELKCPLLLKVLKRVNDLPTPSTKKSKTSQDLVLPSAQQSGTYTGPQMNAMTGTIIMGCSSIRSGQEGFDTVLEIGAEYEDEWAVSTPSRKEVILREVYDRTIRLGFVWKIAVKETNQINGNLYRLEAVTEFSNNINLHPSKDTGSPRKYLDTKICCNIKDQEKAAKSKKENEKKAESQLKAKIKMIKKAPSLFGNGNCLSASDFDILTKISEADIARAEKQIKAVQAMQMVIPPASDSTKDIIHIPTVYIFVAFALLFEFFLKMEASGEPCTFKKLCDTIKEHTGLTFSNFIHEGMFDSYKERWEGDWKGMLEDIVVHLPLLLSGMSALYDCPLGMTWLDIQNSQWDHVLNLFVKKDTVSNIHVSLSIIMIEESKCRAIDAQTHERGERRGHAEKLEYEPVIHYNFDEAGEDGAGIESAEQFFNSKEILRLRVNLEKNGLLDCKGKGLPPEVSWRAVKAILWHTTSVVLSDIHPGNDLEWQAVNTKANRTKVNQLLLYLYKSMSKNPNPNGPRFSDIIPVRKSGVDIHHPIEYNYDVEPSKLVKYPTDYMISELIKGECIPLLAGDHQAVTRYEKKTLKKLPEWLKKFSRFQYNY